MFFVQVNGIVHKYFDERPSAVKCKAAIVRAFNAEVKQGVRRYAPECSLWQIGAKGYPYEDAIKLS